MFFSTCDVFFSGRLDACCMYTVIIVLPRSDFPYGLIKGHHLSSGDDVSLMAALLAVCAIYISVLSEADTVDEILDMFHSTAICQYSPDLLLWRLEMLVFLVFIDLLASISLKTVM